MKIIEKIEIKNFRSFGNRKGETTEVESASSLNIISGANDSGKSNILRAMNLFFNGKTEGDDFFDFERDFFKKDASDDKDVQERVVTIKIWFSNSNNKGKNQLHPDKIYLPGSFWVSRRWKKSSMFSISEPRSNIETSFKHEKGDYYEKFVEDEKLKSTTKASLQKQLTEFLSQIHYYHVPAIKDKLFFSGLFAALQETLWKAKNSTVDRKKTDFQKEIQKETSQLMRDFKKTLVIKRVDFEPVFQLPENLVDLFRTLQVQMGAVQLPQRGDGIQAKLIPEILNFISMKERSYTSRTVRSDVESKKYFIWGFEEPENSYEYKNAQILATKFKQEFIKNAQIFLTTHSFNFISITGDNVSKYRVWFDEEASSSRISRLIEKKDGSIELKDSTQLNALRLNEELGVFSLNEDLETLFENTQVLHNELISKLKDLNSNTRILFVEDKLDQIYKVAWLKLNNIDFDHRDYEEKFVNNAEFKIVGLESAGSVAGLLRSKTTKFLPQSKIVGLFDFDKEGTEHFYGIKREKFWSDNVSGVKENGFYRTRVGNPSWHALLLPVPERLSEFADLDHSNFSNFIEVENLLPEDFLRSNNFVEERKIVGRKYLKIKDSVKDNLWKKAIADLGRDGFSDFQPLFVTFDNLTT